MINSMEGSHDPQQRGNDCEEEKDSRRYNNIIIIVNQLHVPAHTDAGHGCPPKGLGNNLPRYPNVGWKIHIISKSGSPSLACRFHYNVFLYR